ncbi:cyclin-Y-like protein 2 [Aotus nancymaae]|uniref:cyclin-Y-like protein 2 n=1 Tax=Aotus nancymaae TaxID=37293 RepID=UPI0030FF04F1
MGIILSCCVHPKVSPESDQDEGSGCPPDSEICEAAAEDTTAAAAAPTATAVAPVDLTVEAGEGLPVQDICDGEIPEAQEIGENSGTNPKYTDLFSWKFNSCSTIFLEDNTAICPHFHMTLKSVAMEIYYLIKKRDADRTFEVFDERIYPLNQGEVLEEDFMSDPPHRKIFTFMVTLFCVKRLDADSAITSLVYIRRLVKCADIDICPTNWRRIIFGAILVIKSVIHEVLCDEYFCKLFEKTTVGDMYTLKTSFLELINYNTNIAESVFTRHYFYLRQLAFSHGLGMPPYLLDRARAWKLHALSRMEQDEMFYTGRKTRSFSADDLISLQHAKAILS